MELICCSTDHAQENSLIAQPRDISGRPVQLPSPPAVAMRVLEAVKNDEVSLESMARILGSDPALAAKVLRVANSSLYSRCGRVDSIKQAIRVLGINMLRNIALSFVIFEGIGKECDRRLELEAFWRQSIAAAATSELIAALFNIKDDDIFISALLQDIGAIMLRAEFPGPWLNLNSTECGNASPSIERELFGVDHAELAYEILNDWSLPMSICELVRFHHSMDVAPKELMPKLRVLDLARTLSCIFFMEDPHANFVSFTNSLQALYSSSKQDAEALINSAYEKTQEILSFFDIDPGQMKTCSQILQEANEELSKLNLSYEQLLFEYKTAKERAEKLAVELSKANTKLRALAYRDALTGLFNHRYFQDLLDREITRSSRYNRPLSLIMFDLDHFKLVNDRYGHPTGDQVLKRVSELTLKTVRKCDYVARYGGEEFAVILPETGAKGATVLAERIRHTIENMQIDIQGRLLSTTISCGIAVCGNRETGVSKACMIAAADKALYVSKTEGRNRITISSQF